MFLGTSSHCGPRPPEGRRGEELGGLGVVRDVAHGGHGVPGREELAREGQGPDVVVDDGVDGHGDAVLGEDLLRRHVKRHRPGRGKL